jgi:hypothetical protein
MKRSTYCFVRLSSAGSETPKVVTKTRSKAGGNEEALGRIIAVVGTRVPTQELESKRENQLGPEDASPPHRKDKTEQATCLLR